MEDDAAVDRHRPTLSAQLRRVISASDWSEMVPEEDSRSATKHLQLNDIYDMVSAMAPKVAPKPTFSETISYQVAAG